jgi:hypothetical protein
VCDCFPTNRISPSKFSPPSPPATPPLPAPFPRRVSAPLKPPWRDSLSPRRRLYEPEALPSHSRAQSTPHSIPSSIRLTRSIRSPAPANTPPSQTTTPRHQEGHATPLRSGMLTRSLPLRLALRAAFGTLPSGYPRRLGALPGQTFVFPSSTIALSRGFCQGRAPHRSPVAQKKISRPSSKLQAPSSKLQAPSSKLQAPISPTKRFAARHAFGDPPKVIE